MVWTLIICSILSTVFWGTSHSIRELSVFLYFTVFISLPYLFPTCLPSPSLRVPFTSHNSLLSFLTASPLCHTPLFLPFPSSFTSSCSLLWGQSSCRKGKIEGDETEERCGWTLVEGRAARACSYCVYVCVCVWGSEAERIIGRDKYRGRQIAIWSRWNQLD